MIGGHIQILQPKKPLDDPPNHLQDMSVNWEIRGKRLQDITKLRVRVKRGFIVLCYILNLDPAF